MKLGRPPHRVFAGRAAALIAAVLGLLASLFYIGDSFRNFSYDYLFPFRRAITPDGLVIVAIDDASQRTLNQTSDRPWDRRLHARLLDRLTQEGARLVAFDILFDEARDPVADDALERAIRANGKVVLAASISDAVAHPGLLASGGRMVMMPIDRFKTNALSCGVVPLALDPDSVVRRFHPAAWERPIGTLAAEAARLSGLNTARDPSPTEEIRWINHYGPGGQLTRFSFHQVLEPEGVPAGFFRDKIVFVGSQKSADLIGTTRESFATPWTQFSGAFAAGVEIHATMFLNLARGDYFQSLPEWLEACLLIVVGAGIGFALSLLPPVLATIAAGIGIVCVSIASTFLAWQFHVFIPWMIIVVVQIPSALISCVLFSLLSSLHEARTMERLLALHVPASRARQLLVRPELLKPNAEQMELTIMFSDIANFSAVVQRKTPQDLVRLLSNYFESLIHSVHQSEGTVIKLIGDSVFAVWNAPEPQPKHREMACRSALLLREVLDEFDKKSHDLPLRTRIGLHTGPAFVGNFGSTERFDYTAIGDSVNLASRLEGLNEHLGTKVLASRDTLMGLEGLVRSRLVGHFRLKGFDRVVEVHELLGINTEGSTDAEWQAQFGAGLRHYQRREFDRAEAAFRKTLELRESDGPSDFYLRQIALLRTQPPQAGWVGEVNMAQK